MKYHKQNHNFSSCYFLPPLNIELTMLSKTSHDIYITERAPGIYLRTEDQLTIFLANEC